MTELLKAANLILLWVGSGAAVADLGYHLFTFWLPLPLSSSSSRRFGRFPHATRLRRRAKSDEHRKAAQFFFFPSASAGSLACVIVRRAVPAIPGTILSLSCVRVCGGKARALTIDKEVLGKAEEV